MGKSAYPWEFDLSLQMYQKVINHLFVNISGNHMKLLIFDDQ